jgi:peptidoglycan hydrolase CwlO-like protein
VLEEQQGNDMLGLLEDRIEQSINLIHRLRQDKSALEEEVDRLQDEIRQRDLKVQEIEAQNDSLKDTEAELYQLKVKQTETQEETEREKKELRSRLEGIMELLDGVNSEDTLEDTLEDALEDAPEDTPPDQQSFLKLQEEDES